MARKSKVEREKKIIRTIEKYNSHRDELLNQGVVLEDNLDETNWRRS